MIDNYGCGHRVTGGRIGVRVDARDRSKRRYTSVGLICEGCWDSLGRRRGTLDDWLSVLGLYGGAVETAPLPCEACGLVVIRGAHPRTKRHTCSRSCTARLSKTAHPLLPDP